MKKLRKMTTPVDESALRKIKIGQWVKTHWADHNPIWMLSADRYRKGYTFLFLYDVINGIVEEVPLCQISAIGGRIQVPVD